MPVDATAGGNLGGPPVAGDSFWLELRIQQYEPVSTRRTLEAFGSDDYTFADSYTLADHLTFESMMNPESIWNCFAYTRENVREVRNDISAEMWLSLNMAYLRLQ